MHHENLYNGATIFIPFQYNNQCQLAITEDVNILKIALIEIYTYIRNDFYKDFSLKVLIGKWQKATIGVHLSSVSFYVDFAKS